MTKISSYFFASFSRICFVRKITFNSNSLATWPPEKRWDWMAFWPFFFFLTSRKTISGAQISSYFSIELRRPSFKRKWPVCVCCNNKTSEALFSLSFDTILFLTPFGHSFRAYMRCPSLLFGVKTVKEGVILSFILNYIWY